MWAVRAVAYADAADATLTPLRFIDADTPRASAIATTLYFVDIDD